MVKSKKLILEFGFIIIALLISFICLYFMFNSVPDAKSYYEVINESQNGDIVYVYGEFRYSGELEDNSVYGNYYVELDSVESVDYETNDRHSRVDLDVYIYFDEEQSVTEEVGGIVIKGRVMEEEGEKYIKGLEIYDSVSFGYWNNDLVQITPWSIFILLTLPIVTLSGVLFYHKYKIRKDQVLQPNSQIKPKKIEKFNIFLFLFGTFLLYTFIISPLLVFLLVGLGLYLQFRVIKSKYVIVLEKKDEVLINRFARAIKLVKFGILIIMILLIIVSISSLLFYPEGGFLPLIGSTLSVKDFYTIFLTFTILYIIGSFIFFFGNNIDTRRFHPEIENKLKTLKKKRTRPIFIALILIILMAGIIYPFFFMLTIPTLQTSENLTYNDALEKHNPGDSVIIFADNLYYYNYENGKTIIIISESSGSSHIGESDYYSVVEFSGDQTNKLPPLEQSISFRGIIKETESGHKYVEGKEIILVDLSSIFIIPISFNILILIIMLYYFDKLRNFKEISELQLQNIQCPACHKTFKIAEDEKLITCPYCGVSGEIEQ